MPEKWTLGAALVLGLGPASLGCGGGHGGTGATQGSGGAGGSSTSSSSTSGSSTGSSSTSGSSTSSGGTYTLAPDRACTWSDAGMLGKGGIPSASWPVCNATPLKPSGGDDSAPINQAIAACAPGKVVQLAAGTFLMGQGSYVAIDRGVVLRGAGADAACWFSRQDRPQNEIKEIAGVSGKVVTFTSPLHKDYRTSHHAELTTYTGGNRHVVNAGLEELTVVGGGDGAVRFENAAYSWARNIEVTTWYGEGVAIDDAFRVELRDSYIHDAAWAEPGGAGYAVSLAGGSSEVLIENNISIKANKVIVARASGTCSVVGYNYLDDGYIATTEPWIEIGLNASHMVGAHHVLFEGNQAFNLDSDNTHGASTYHTYFRNYATSVRAKFKSGYTGDTIDDASMSANGPKRAAGAMGYSYWMSFVGNVLGQAGVATAANGYVDDVTSTDWGNSIWLLGWNAVDPYTPDAKVAATAVRDGNWDALLGQQTWLTGSPAPLPSSLYLPGKPAFFGTSPWPWVDPTTGTLETLPAKERWDAGTPNVVP